MRFPASSLLTRQLAPLLLASSLLSAACAGPLRQAGHSLPAQSDEEEAALSSGGTSPSPETHNSALDEADADSPPSAHPSPSPASPAPQFSEVPKEGQLVGSTGGIAVEHLSPGGHWLSYCQASGEGEDSQKRPVKTTAQGLVRSATELFLMIGSETESIDALLRFDSQGRYLVTQKEGKAWLIDAHTLRRVDLSPLSPDLRSDALTEHRSFSFSSQGLYILSSSTDSQGYFIPLPLTDEPIQKNAQPLHFSKRPVWRLTAGAGGVAASTIAEKETPSSWPAPLRKEAKHRCYSGTQSFSAFSKLSAYRPDQSIETVWLALPRGGKTSSPLTAQPAPGFVLPFKNGWVRREDSGRLLFVSGRVQKQIASAACGARIIHADESSGLFFIACEQYTPTIAKKSRSKKRRSKPKYRFELYLIRPGYVRSLKGDTSRTGVDVGGRHKRDLVSFRPGADAALVDFKKRTLHRLPKGALVLTHDDQSALFIHENKLKLWTSTQASLIESDLPRLPQIITGDAVASIDSELFLLEDGKLRNWTLPGAPLAISPLGYSLIPKVQSTEESWALGPLLLLGPPSPTPPTPSSP